jgi:S1-C subfamily serine protease
MVTEVVMAGNPLLELSESLAAIVDRVAPSLVALERTHAPATGTAIGPDLVVTVAHVMGRSTEGSVRLPDGKEAKAVLVGTDRATDLALVRVEGGALPVPELDENAALRAGHLVLSVGRPGRHARSSLASVAGVGDAWRTAKGAAVDRFVDVDGALPFGFSGGPLVDMRGTVVGINTHGLVRGGTTLPFSTVKRVTAALAKHGTAKNGYLRDCPPRSPRSSGGKRACSSCRSPTTDRPRKPACARATSWSRSTKDRSPRSRTC